MAAFLRNSARNAHYLTRDSVVFSWYNDTMTSGTILPSIGPPPPEFRRSFVPEHMRPKPVGSAGQETPARSQEARPEPKATSGAGNGKGSDEQQNKNAQNSPAPAARERSAQNVAATLGGPSAVTVQVQESNLEIKEEPAPKDTGQQKLENQLTEEERKEVQRLKERDREVRAHEAAHASVGRGFTGSPNFEYVTGPDGVRYAVGGHVDIDVSEVPDNPEATIDKMEVVRAAALAPARPSGQDRAVAREAATKAQEARAELAEERREEIQKQTENRNETPAEEQSQKLSGAEATAQPSANGATSQTIQGSNETPDNAAPILPAVAGSGLGIQPAISEPISINLLV